MEIITGIILIASIFIYIVIGMILGILLLNREDDIWYKITILFAWPIVMIFLCIISLILWIIILVNNFKKHHKL